MLRVQEGKEDRFGAALEGSILALEPPHHLEPDDYFFAHTDDAKRMADYDDFVPRPEVDAQGLNSLPEEVPSHRNPDHGIGYLDVEQWVRTEEHKQRQTCRASDHDIRCGLT